MGILVVPGGKNPHLIPLPFVSCSTNHCSCRSQHRDFHRVLGNFMPHVSLFHEVPWSGCYSISTVRRFKSWICRSSDSRVTFSWCAGFSKVPQEYLAHWLSIARVLLSHLVAFENPSWWAHFLLRNRFIFTVKRDSLPSPTSAKSCIFFQWHGLIFKYLRAFWIWNNSSFLLTTSLHATHSLLPPPSPLPILIALYVSITHTLL